MGVLGEWGECDAGLCVAHVQSLVLRASAIKMPLGEQVELGGCTHMQCIDDIAALQFLSCNQHVHLQSMAKEIQALGGEDDAVVMKLIGRTLSSEGPHCPFSLCEPDDQEVLTLENTQK
jgi:hypothetical protein